MNKPTKDFKRRFVLGRTSYGDLWITIEYQDGKLSITGVEGPKKNGDCKGSFGQCVDAAREINKKFADIWKCWHLNNMRPGCEHQREEGWNKRSIDPTKPLNSYGIHFNGQISPSLNMLAWISPDEHPDGLLTRPCSVCGYKYGSAWLHEKVPENILKYLSSFPDEDDHPWGE